MYLFEMPEDSLLYQDTSRHWSGTLAQFVARHADLLRPRRVILDHHGDWLPGFSLPTRITPIREAMARAVARTELVELDYLSSYPLFEGLR